MKFVIYFCLLLGLVHCSHLNSSNKANIVNAENAEMAPPVDSTPIQVGKAQEKSEDLSDSESDMQALPEEINQNVHKWISYFQGKGRPHMERYLSRSTRYIPKMKEILKSHGLPEDLVYIALIESGFNPKAYSRASAVGYWQFIRGTGRRYGLRSNYYVDERRDFVKSTEAAAKYLKALYNLFGSWYLAIASYNVGENRIKNLVMTYYTRDFWELARNRHLPSETENYVPKFLAARLIAKHPEKYGFMDLNYSAPLDFQTIEHKKAISLHTLAQQLGMNYEELRGLNPSYKRGIAPIYKGIVEIRVPSQLDKEKVLAALDRSSQNVVVNQAYAKDEEGYIKYRIRRGDTLSTIARRFKVSLSAILRLNGLSKRSMIRAGKEIRIPQDRSISSDKSSNYKQARRKLIHVVKRGETLIHIANKYKVRISQIISANRLRSQEKILVGNRLIIPR